MTQRWVIMVWLTRNQASAQQAASADQSKALLQCPLTTKLRITVATAWVNIQRYNRIHWHQSCPGKVAAGGCPSAPCSGARPQPVPAPARCAGAAQPMLMAPAEAYREARSTRQSPKANRSSRRLWSFKSEIPPEIESKTEMLVKDQSERWSTKRESTEVRIEAGSSLRSRNLGFRSYCRL